MDHYGKDARPRQEGRRVSSVLVASLVAFTVCSTALGAEPGPSTVAGFGVAIDSLTLDALRGGDVSNDLRNNGIVNDNHAENVNSGTNTLTGSAFSNASGISTVIQNSGSNVLIQNAMIVNVQFAGGGP